MVTTKTKDADPLADAMGADSIEPVRSGEPDTDGPVPRFAGLTVDRGKRKMFSGSATVIEPEVKTFVEALYEAFHEDPDWWYPHDAGSEDELTRILDQARTYAQIRAEGRVTVSMRREPSTKGTGWFRVSGYTHKGRKGGDSTQPSAA